MAQSSIQMGLMAMKTDKKFTSEKIFEEMLRIYMGTLNNKRLNS